MNKKTAVKKKTVTGLTNLVPSATHKRTDTAPKTPKPKDDKPEGRITLSFRVTPTQYRKLVEMRLDERSTIHKLLEKAVSYYFEHEHGTTF